MLRILVVEDDQKLSRVVCNHLNSHGYEATGAGTPRTHTTRCTTVPMR